jgi:hypothetical protein
VFVPVLLVVGIATDFMRDQRDNRRALLRLEVRGGTQQASMSGGCPPARADRSRVSLAPRRIAVLSMDS